MIIIVILIIIIFLIIIVPALTESKTVPAPITSIMVSYIFFASVSTNKLVI